VIEYQHFTDEWAFPYIAHQIFELDGPSLTVTLQITNSGKTEMPAGMGLHIYFVRTPLAIITAKTEKMWGNDSENIPLRLQLVQELECLSQGLNVNKKNIGQYF
jgi:aldose 1-epimerase